MLIGVERLAGSDEVIPPTGLTFIGPTITDIRHRRIDPGGVLAAAEGVEHEHRIRGFLVQFAIGLVGERRLRKRFPVGKNEGILGSGNDLKTGLYAIGNHEGKSIPDRNRFRPGQLESFRSGSSRLQGLFEIRDDVIGIFDTDAEANHLR